MLDPGKYYYQNEVITIANCNKINKALCLTGCLFFFLTLSCKNDMQVVNELYTSEEVKYDVADNPVLTYTEQGMKRLDITAPELRSWSISPRKMEFPRGLKVAFYNGRTNTSNLSADYGVNLEQSKQLVVEGNVIFENNNGEMLETEKLTWIEKEAKIQTDAEVRITTANEIITGYGLEADEDFSNYSIQSISGIVNVEDE
ncbi:MAG: LPS export ABC transporter periplasmic protein LptC [Bacteroidetes bacterium]|nr:LPS export ABC transporter periplasmic protein LptC [Bacteroidota bacterium]